MLDFLLSWLAYIYPPDRSLELVWPPVRRTGQRNVCKLKSREKEQIWVENSADQLMIHLPTGDEELCSEREATIILGYL